MDPLSIAGTAAGLVGCVAKTSFWIFEVIDSTRRANTTLDDLSHEVTTLQGLLKSLEKTLKDFNAQALTLAYVDDDMWTRMGATLDDCKATLSSLDGMLLEIRESASARNFWRRPNIQMRLAIHADEIAGFRDKIHKSNCAMQTSLAVVNVSMNLRLNTSQQLLMRELRMLSELIRNAFSVADNPHHLIDPASARLSENLHGLAQAAKSFFSAASSSASTSRESRDTRYSTVWMGSDVGDLPDSRRQRIVEWNASQLQVVDEESELASTAASNSELSTSIQTDIATALTTPDDEGDAEDSDIDHDFLRNFEELAHESFSRGYYAKAEQFLTKATEMSTGVSINDAEFRVLNIRLAASQCMQEKWDQAAHVLIPIGKLRSTTELPAFLLLQSIALAFYHGSRVDDAHGICKLALQGKKKLLGKTANEYYHCLSLLARIWERKGDHLQAEGIRHSIPRSFPDVPLTSAAEYVAHHPLLLNSLWGEDEPGSEAKAKAERLQTPDRRDGATTPGSQISTRSGEEDATSPADFGHWSRLTIHNNVRTGVMRANTDSLSLRQLGETDSGKEVYRDVQMGELDFGKEVMVKGDEVTAPPMPPPVSSEADAVVGAALNINQTPLRPSLSKRKGKIWTYADLIDQAQRAAPPRINIPESDTFKMVAILEEETKSPDPVKTIQPSNLRKQPPPTPEAPTITITEDSAWFTARTWVPEQGGSSNWEEQSFLCPEARVLQDGYRVPTLLDTAAERVKNHFHVGVSIELDSATVSASFGETTLQPDNSKMFFAQPSSPLTGEKLYLLNEWIRGAHPWLERYTESPASPLADSVDPWAKHNWRLLHLIYVNWSVSGYAASQAFATSLIKIPRSTLFDSVTSTRREVVDCFLKLESSLRKSMQERCVSVMPSEPKPAVQGVVVSISDVLHQHAPEHFRAFVVENRLLKWCHIIPQSFAVISYFLRNSGLQIERNPFRIKASEKQVTIVLICGEVLAESVVYKTRLKGRDVVLYRVDDVKFDLCGSIHAEMMFFQLVQKRLRAIMSQFKLKIGASTVQEVAEAASCHFRKVILPSFANDGCTWGVRVNVPNGFPGIEAGLMVFQNEEILSCIRPSVTKVIELFSRTVLHLTSGRQVSRVLVAGSYCKSSFLNRQVEECVARFSRFGGEVKLIKAHNPESVVAQGTLDFARSLRMD